MIVLKAIDTAQVIETRVRPHSFTDYLIAFESFENVTAYVADLDYEDGMLSGIITIPLSTKNGSTANVRIFSCTTENAIIDGILDDGGVTYGTSEWASILNGLAEDYGVEKEVFRGISLITNQTDLDKYELYGAT